MVKARICDVCIQSVRETDVGRYQLVCFGRTGPIGMIQTWGSSRAVLSPKLLHDPLAGVKASSADVKHSDTELFFPLLVCGYKSLCIEDLWHLQSEQSTYPPYLRAGKSTGHLLEVSAVALGTIGSIDIRLLLILGL